MEHVMIQEVGPRDGLQNQKVILSVKQRVEFIELLIGAGLKRIQVGSFVTPKLLPQMANTSEVRGNLNKYGNVRLSVLVLNEKGLDSAIQAGSRHVEMFVSASETHSLKNTGMSVIKAVEIARRVLEKAKSAGISVSAGVMCAFGCEFEGAIDQEAVERIISNFCEFHPDEISLADTTGQGHPELLGKMITRISRFVPTERISLHLHDTYGAAEANVLKGLELGVRMFDSSVGALGGCPFIPGAAGNISTERLASLLENRGYLSGIDADRLEQARIFISSALKSVQG
ncbi:MAG: hydroxymethylglutaryl-CoA lyase [Desulfomonilaceae bacterium]